MSARIRIAGLGLLALAAAAGAALWLWPAAEPRPAAPDAGADLGAALGDLDPEARRLFRRLAVGGAEERVRKWTRPMTVTLGEGATEADRRAAAAAVAALNAWIPKPGVRLRPGGDAAVAIEFVERQSIASSGAPFSVELEVEGGAIRGARIAIPKHGVEQRRRSRFIYHALGKALGLDGTLERPTGSIFYYGPAFSAWTYEPIDRALITALYRPEIPPGTPAAAIDAALEDLAPAHSD